MKAYLLVQTATDAPPIAWELRDVPGVSFAEDLQGPYDAIALAGSGERRLQTIIPDIQRLAGVTRVLAAPIVGSLAQPDDEAA